MNSEESTSPAATAVPVGPATVGADVRDGRTIVSAVLSAYRGPVAVRLWDGSLAVGWQDAPCTVFFRDSATLCDLVLHRDLMQLAEAHLAGEVDIEGDPEVLFDLSAYLENLRIPWSTRLRLMRCALHLSGDGYRRVLRHRRVAESRRVNSAATIAYHYDVGNDFYGLWLDPEYVYSCAYFRDPAQPLAEAQRDKLDYICRKLRLTPGQRLLDIGCGWGALALWAARHYGARVHGITLSAEQQKRATERVQQEGLGDQVEIELLDYRDLQGDERYDCIASVGMFEHVGVRNFPTYFGVVRRLLKPGGLFLNHGITSEAGWRRTPLTRFMNQYIFPDGELARIGDVVGAMERQGFEILDLESLRPHYPLTLRHWSRALCARRDAVIAVSSEVTYRLWRLYMAGSAYFFEQGSIGVYQILAGRAHGRPSVPLRRDDLYRAREH